MFAEHVGDIIDQNETGAAFEVTQINDEIGGRGREFRVNKHVKVSSKLLRSEGVCMDLIPLIRSAS